MYDEALAVLWGRSHKSKITNEPALATPRSVHAVETFIIYYVKKSYLIFNHIIKGISLLLYAAMSGHKSLVRTLLSEGANPNHHDDRGSTPSMEAVKSHEIVKLLLSYGADPSLRDREDETPLLKAAWSGYYAAVKVLLERGASCHLKDRRGQTPLFKAILMGYCSLVELLLDRGALCHLKDVNGNTPSFSAKHRGHTREAQNLILRETIRRTDCTRHRVRTGTRKRVLVHQTNKHPV